MTRLEEAPPGGSGAASVRTAAGPIGGRRRRWSLRGRRGIGRSTWTLIIVVGAIAALFGGLIAAGQITFGNAGVTGNPPYPVLFKAFGLPSGAKWCAVITGQKPYCTTKPNETFMEISGTYNYTMTTTKAGYSAPAGEFTVNYEEKIVRVSFKT